MRRANPIPATINPAAISATDSIDPLPLPTIPAISKITPIAAMTNPAPVVREPGFLTPMSVVMRLILAVSPSIK